MENIKSILNLLALLKREPMNIEKLWESDCFYSWKYLRKTIGTCLKANLIRIEVFDNQKLDVKEVMSQPSLHRKKWHRRIYCYYLTDKGLAFISFYSRYGEREIELVIR